MTRSVAALISVACLVLSACGAPPLAAIRATADPMAADQAKARAYDAVVAQHNPEMDQATGEAGCSAPVVPAQCRRQLADIRDAAQSYLEALPVPPSTLPVTADNDLREALRDDIAGSNLAITGIDSTDKAQVDAGAAMLGEGAALMKQASDALPT